MIDNRGAWEVMDEEEHVARVDNTSGELLGTITRGGGVMGFVSNLHTCALSCEESPGYVSFLDKPAQMAGVDLSWATKATWGGFILAVTAILLLAAQHLRPGALVARPQAAAARLQGAARRGRYKLNYDLHKVAGFVAVPFLLMWAVTGAMFELPDQMNAAWYALTPGSEPAEGRIRLRKAEQGRVGLPGRGAGDRPGRGPGRLATDLDHRPGPRQRGIDLRILVQPRGRSLPYGPWPGNYGVAVDRYSGAHPHTGCPNRRTAR